MPFPRQTPTIKHQRGAALMVMLVILVIGAAALLVNALNSSSLQIARDKTTADALAQAKDALIAYAVSDANRPGELPCPDFNNDGMITVTPFNDYSGSNCKSLVGWLPWQTLGLPDLRDGNGDRLWYAVANPFHANSNAILNSDTPTTLAAQMLTVNDGATGATLASGVIAIVFSPGTPLASETRSPNDNAATNTILKNYLEGSNANTLSTMFQTGNGTTINDRLLTISSNSLFPPVERRIAREAKHCLDDYATINGQYYPWTADVSDITLYNSTSNTLFGRLPTVNLTSNNTGVNNMLNALSALQVAANNCAAANNSSNANALFNAGNTLESAAKNVASDQPTLPAISSTITSPAIQAGDKAQDSSRCSSINSNPTSNSVQNYLNQTFTAISTSFPFNWTPSCTLPTSNYWADWKNQIFYQTDTAYKPGGVLGTPNLKINGSGPYRAVVLIARAAVGTQNRTNPATSPPYGYLANNPYEYSPDPAFVANAHTNAALTTTFITYNPSDPYYKNVNDLVLCLDGKGVNLGSVCQ